MCPGSAGRRTFAAPRCSSLDSSALVKLVIEERETSSVQGRLLDVPLSATGWVALVEVLRATSLPTQGRRSASLPTGLSLSACSST